MRESTPDPLDGTACPTLSGAGASAGPDGQPAQASAPGGIGQRAGVIVHDFNNVLATITAIVAEALARPGLDAVARAEFSEIGGAARRGASLVRQLLDGEPPAAPVILGIDAALRALEAPLRRCLGDIPLSLVLEQPGAAVRIDPAHLDRVLTNLALNARHAMPSGGVLSVRSGVRDVSEAVSQFGDSVAPGRYVTIAVRDTGTGIPAAIMARLFEPFLTTRAGRGGTGLGLAGVRDLVRQAGGFLGVDTRAGRGTTMWVHLPCEEGWAGGAARLDGTGDDLPAASSAHGAVLLVEDEPALLRLAERALSRAGWDVLAAACATSALDAARGAGRAPCLVVSDMTLPDRDGLALVGELRALFPGLPALLTSGYAGEALRVEAEAAGTALLVKPFTTAELLDAISRTLASRG